MVRVTDHRFDLAGMSYNANKAAAFFNPTVFSGLKVTYGADTCSDHPAPSTLSGRVFIPEAMAAFYPTLNTPTSYAVAGPGGRADVFKGRVESLTIEDVDGFRPPARFVNSRSMTTLTPGLLANRWNFYTRANDRPEVASTGALTTSPHRVQATPAALVTDQPIEVRIMTPYAPVTAGQQYSFAAHARSVRQFGTPVWFHWYSNNAGTGLIRVDQTETSYASSRNDVWFGLLTAPLAAPAGATHVRVSVELSAGSNASPFGPVSLDTVTLLTAAERKLRPAGRWVDFQASDVTAIASRLMVSDTPWPDDTADNRTVRLNRLVPRDVIYFGTSPIDYTPLAARDVDNQSAMGLFQRLCTSIGSVAVASPEFDTYITTGRAPRSPYSLEMVAGNPVIVDDADLVKIPAGSIVDGPLSTSITGLSNQVKFAYRSWLGDKTEDATATVQNDASIAAYGPMARSVETDLPAPMGKAWEQAQRLVTAQAQPVYRLANSTQVVLSQLAETQPSWDVFNAVEGFRRLVHVPDAPALIGPYHRISSAEMVFGKSPSLSLDLEPADQISSESVTFYDLSQYPYNNVPLSKFTSLTFEQLDFASKSAE